MGSLSGQNWPAGRWTRPRFHFWSSPWMALQVRSPWGWILLTRQKLSSAMPRRWATAAHNLPWLAIFLTEVAGRDCFPGHEKPWEGYKSFVDSSKGGTTTKEEGGRSCERAWQEDSSLPEGREQSPRVQAFKSEPIAQLEMGIYLSTPKTEKLSEDGENGRVRYGSSSMQGWRATMEDAHATYPDLDASTSFFWCLWWLWR